MEDVREYLHLYPKCKVQTPTRRYASSGGKSFKAIGTLMEIDWVIDKAGVHFPENRIEDLESYRLSELKPILRRLDSMTEEEMEDVWHMIEPKNVLTMNYEDGRCRKVALVSERTIYLLSRGFWLFNDEAFDKGLIIDKSTV